MSGLPAPLQAILPAVLIILFVPVLLLPLVYAFLKIHSHIMSRVGPMYAGRFHGIGQPVADFLKFIQKEDIIPTKADRKVFALAPFVVLIPAILLFAVIPIWPGVVAADIDLGLFYLLAISGIGAIGIVMAAASSANKFTLMGGVRAVGQIIAYELPVVFGAAAVAMLAGSMNLTEIAQAQDLPFAIWPFPFGAIALLIFLAASLAEVMWAPFDMPLAESEIVTGPFTEYSGMRFLFFFFAEFAHILALSAIGTVLFFGGWRGPGASLLPAGMEWVVGIGWLVLKISAFSFFFIWIRFTLPRLREDQLQKFAWKVLIPVGLLNILGIALFKVLA